MDEIWVWEAVQHGDSALLNGDSLGYLRMMNLISQVLLMTTSLQLIGQIMGVHYFIPASLTDAPLPTCLRRVDPEETKYRLKHGFGNRTLVGIGHSYGGCTT